MTLMHRIARLFRADVHAVLDRIEEPELLLRQAVREMEGSLANDRRQLALCQEAQSQLGERLKELSAGEARIQKELDLCFETNREDLAKKLLRQRLEMQHTRESLVREQKEREREVETLTKRIAENSARLETMRRKAEVLQGDAGKPDAAEIVSDEEVEIAFLQEQRRRQSS